MLKLKERLELSLTKAYLPSQNEVLKLRPDEKAMMGKSENNILGKRQGIEMTHTLEDNREDEEAKAESFENGEGDRQVWASELRAADERAAKFRDQAAEVEKELLASKENVKRLAKQIEARDGEIKRLQGLYEGGQGLDKLATRYVEDTSDQIVTRLNGHIDFLNKENHRLSEELNKCDPQNRAAVASLEGRLNSKILQLTKKNESLNSKVSKQEKLMQQLDGEKAALAEQLARLQATSEEKIIREQQRTLSLSNQIKSLEGQIDSTQKEIESSSYLKAAYASDKKAYAGAVEDLKSEKAVLGRQNRELMGDVQRLKGQVEEMRNEVNVYKGKYANATREIDMSRTNAERLKNEAHEQAEECTSLRKQLRDLEAELLGAKSEKSNLKFEIERQGRQKAILEQQLDSLKGESLKKRSEVESSGAANVRLEALHNAAQAEIEYLKRDNQQLEQLLAQQKAKVAELDRKAKEYYMEITAKQGNMELLQNEQRLLSEELLAKSSELRNTAAEKSQLELKVKDSRSLELQIETMNSQLYKARQENLRVENEKGTLLASISQLETDLSLAKDQVSKLNERITFLTSESDQCRSKAQKLEEEGLNLRDELERVRMAEKELAMHKTTLEKMRKQDSGMAGKLEEVQLKLKWCEIENESNRKKAEIASKRADDLELELSSKREELFGLKARLGDVEKAGSASEERKKDLLSQVSEARATLLEMQQAKSQFELAATNLAKELEASKARELTLKQQVAQLKGIIEELDASNGKLMNHINSTVQDKETEKTLIKKLELLKSEGVKKEKELNEARENVGRMNAALDTLQNELDGKTEECEKNNKKIKEIVKEMDLLRAKAGEQLVSEEVFNKRIMDRENEVKKLRAQVEEIAKELEEARDLLLQKEKENIELNNDIQIISQENQYVNAELVRLNESQSELKQMTEGLQMKEQEAHDTLRSHQEEKDDLLNSYKVVCDANEQQKLELESLSAENRDLFVRLQETGEIVKAQEGKVQELQQNVQRYLAEIKMQERQINQLVKELENAQKIIKEEGRAREEAQSETEHAHKVVGA